jgi:hypothetical protein
MAATSDKPGADAGAGTGLIGGQVDLAGFNTAEVHLGLAPDLALLAEMERYLATQSGLEDLDALKAELARKKDGSPAAALTSSIPLPPR